MTTDISFRSLSDRRNVRKLLSCTCTYADVVRLRELPISGHLRQGRPVEWRLWQQWLLYPSHRWLPELLLLSPPSSPEHHAY